MCIRSYNAYLCVSVCVQQVYEENEDDDKERQKEEEGEKAQSEERPAEEKQMEVVSRIRDAVSCGLKVLNEAFTKLEVQDEASEKYIEFT